MGLKRKIIPVTALLLIAALLAWGLWPSPVPATVVTAKRGFFAEFVEEEGETVLRDPIIVLAPITGYLRRVRLEAGDRVEAGDLLFQMEAAPAPALDQRTRQQARADVGAAEARLAARRGEWQARQAERSQAERELRRAERLRADGVISAAELDFARDERARAEGLETAAAKSVEAALFELRNQEAILAVAKGERASEDNLLEVRASLSGVVLRRHRWSEGPVQAGDPILELGDLSQLEVRVELLSVDAVPVAESMRVELTRWGGDRDLTGRVRRVEPAGFTEISALGVEEQRVPVWVVFEEPRDAWDLLGVGYRVEARFVLWESDDVLQVPSSALFRHEGGWALFVVEAGRARLRQVEPGRRSGLWTQVISGVQSGERVIARPGDEIVAGRRVEAETRSYR